MPVDALLCIICIHLNIPSFFLYLSKGVSDLECAWIICTSRKKAVKIWKFVFPPKQLSHQNWEASGVSPKFCLGIARFFTEVWENSNFQNFFLDAHVSKSEISLEQDWNQPMTARAWILTKWYARDNTLKFFLTVINCQNQVCITFFVYYHTIL